MANARPAHAQLAMLAAHIPQLYHSCVCLIDIGHRTSQLVAVLLCMMRVIPSVGLGFGVNKFMKMEG
jgi:hypothetical protein